MNYTFDTVSAAASSLAAASSPAAIIPAIPSVSIVFMCGGELAGQPQWRRNRLRHRRRRFGGLPCQRGCGGRDHAERNILTPLHLFVVTMPI